MRLPLFAFAFVVACSDALPPPPFGSCSCPSTECAGSSGCDDAGACITRAEPVSTPCADGGYCDGFGACGPGCSAKEKRCGGACVSIYDPATGCALASCDPCTSNHATSTCGIGGECEPASCDPGWSDCDPNLPGCDTYTAGDLNYCGTCSNACPPGSTVCVMGQCQ